MLCSHLLLEIGKLSLNLSPRSPWRITLGAIVAVLPCNTPRDAPILTARIVEVRSQTPSLAAEATPLSRVLVLVVFWVSSHGIYCDTLVCYLMPNLFAIISTSLAAGCCRVLTAHAYGEVVSIIVYW